MIMPHIDVALLSVVICGLSFLGYGDIFRGLNFIIAYKLMKSNGILIMILFTINSLDYSIMTIKNILRVGFCVMRIVTCAAFFA